VLFVGLYYIINLRSFSSAVTVW